MSHQLRETHDTELRGLAVAGGSNNRVRTCDLYALGAVGVALPGGMRRRGLASRVPGCQSILSAAAGFCTDDVRTAQPDQRRTSAAGPPGQDASHYDVLDRD